MRFLLAAAFLPLPALAEIRPLEPVTLPEWKSVQATVEARDRIAARARLGGVLVELAVSAGDRVAAGQVIGRSHDDKLTFRLEALDASLAAARAQLANAREELTRGESLSTDGIATVQRLDQLRTAVAQEEGRIAALKAERRAVEAQVAEGEIRAPEAGIVLSVPVARGALVLPGEPVAEIAGGGTFLRLAIPERHAARLKTGDAIRIETPSGEAQGRLVKLYPLIRAGRVEADVEVPDLSAGFVAARVLVRVPVGERRALVVPLTALSTRDGLDFVATTEGERLVLPGERLDLQGVASVEILSGLEPGDRIETEAAR